MLKYRSVQGVFAVVLAAGKGKRMQATDKNKVAYEVGGKPMVQRTIELLENVGINNIFVVVGFAKNSVLNLLGPHIKTVEQKKRLGTGHALMTALKVVPDNARAILVLNGDDSFSYSPQVIKELIKKFNQEKAAVCFLTTLIDTPAGLGRIVRGTSGEVLGIVEEKDATDKQKRISEINTGCYLFDTIFLRKYLKRLEKNPITGEYYLTDLVGLAAKNNLLITAIQFNDLDWKGVNTKDELKAAEQMFSQSGHLFAEQAT